MITVQLEGFDALQVRLAELPPKIQRSVMRKSIRSICTRIARTIKAGTPRGAKLPHAADRVGITVKSTNTVATGKVYYKGRPAMYMRIREHGDARQPGRPFFASTLGNWQQDANREFETALERAVVHAEG